MPTREQTIADAVTIFERAVYPQGLSIQTAWLGIYQVLLWYEPVNWLDIAELPHIIDSDKLRPSSPAKKRTWKKPNAWQKRAQSLSLHLAAALDCTIDQLPGLTDQLMKHADYSGMQRQNTLGIAFSGLVSHLLAKFGTQNIAYESEVDASTVFPGITFPGRSGTPRMDLLAKKDGVPRGILSAKWSMRHDRLSDITNECPVYKAAYQRIYRKHHTAKSVLYYVLTNEYDPSRLGKILDDSCIDGVVHVCKAGVVQVCNLNGRAKSLIDLSDFIKLSSSW